MLNLTVEQLSLLVAFVAVIAGPIVTIYVTRFQVRATVVSASRQLWINTVRDEISTLLSILQWMVITDRNKNKNAFDAKSSEFMFHSSKLQLLVNPGEPLNKELIAKFIETSKIVINNSELSAYNIKKLNELREDIVALAQQILKIEWKVVRSMR